MVWENIKMVITRLKIKTGKEITLNDMRQQDSAIFALELLLPNRLVFTSFVTTRERPNYMCAAANLNWQTFTIVFAI